MFDRTFCTRATRVSAFMPSTPLPWRTGFISQASSLAAACLMVAVCATTSAYGQQIAGGSKSARPIIAGNIDQGSLVSLKGNVLPRLTHDKDLGAVEDSSPQRLYLVLQRSPAQQSDLDAFLSEQQNAASPNFHKWLTPEQFGERFGAAEADIKKITIWLESQGFEVTSIAKNASIINFKATAGGVRSTFQVQLHYFNVSGGKYSATTTEPQIPAALSGIVSGIAGLNKLPMHEHHTAFKQTAYDAETHKWHEVDAAAAASLARGEKPHFVNSDGGHAMTPQDFYTIYNVNPVYSAGNLGAGGTVAIIGEQDMMYGTVNSATGQATGGDVVTFRNLFGVKGTLNMTVQHGDANYPCDDPGGDSGETALDAEWSSSLAPAAHLIVETCSPATGGMLNDFQTLVDANVADVISSSLGSAEVMGADNSAFDTVFAQAATQGQTIMIAEGDSGSDDIDFGVSGPATHGLSIDFPGSSPLILSIGGTDYQDVYDADRGSSIPVSTYWAASNSQYYGDALSYVPETVWEDGCANTIIALDPNFGNGLSPAAYCATGAHDGVEGGGEGGISVNYAQPSYQTGIQGLSASITKRATPDISGFAGGGFWGHYTIACDSGTPSQDCTSPSTFGGAGGTSFASPELAGVFTLLKVGTGSRQGLVQPALYALAKAQYSSGTNCYANGQASNTGITTGPPASSCIFHDVTTGDNDNACVSGSINCFSNAGASVGVLTASGNDSTLALAWPSGVGYDIATGLGSVNVANLISKWNTAFSSSTALNASPTTISSSESTTLKATVTVAQPNGATGSSPAVTGSVSFKSGTTSLGSCTLAGGTCSISVVGSMFALGDNSVTATYAGNKTYPTSTSAAVTVTAGGTLATITSPMPGTVLSGANVTFTWTAGTDAKEYELQLGVNGVGSQDLYNSGQIKTTTVNVTGLPTFGQKVYARLFSLINGKWQSVDYTYTEAGAPVAATMITPTTGSTFTGSSVTFTWTAGGAVKDYELQFGVNGVGTQDLYNSGAIKETSVTATVPTSGKKVYVRLFSLINGVWQHVDYTYFEATAVPAVSVKHQPATASRIEGVSGR